MTVYSSREVNPPYSAHLVQDSDALCSLDTNSPHAASAFGLMSRARSIVRTAGAPAETLEPVYLTLSAIVDQASIRLSGRSDAASGLHVRLRGLMHSMLDDGDLPPLTPETYRSDQAWQQWANGMVEKLVTQATIIARAFENPSQGAPWAALTQQVAAAEQPMAA